MGTVVLSVDAELGWGFHDQSRPPADRLENARRGWESLLDLCDEFGIEATWAVVGHLFLRDCDGRHSDHPRDGAWFAHERPPNQMAADLRFGNGLVEAIQDAATDHEVGCHTFSHVEFGDPRTTRREARAEVTTSLELAREQGLELDSFVFPRNKVGHLDALAAYGFRCYRGVRPEKSRLGNGALGKLTRATVVRHPPPLVEPRVDSFGLVDIPASLHLFSFEGLARKLLTPLSGDPVVRQAKLGIDAAVESERVFHMWLHPNSITTPQDERRLRTIFTYLTHKRASTPLQVETMGEVARRTLAASEEQRTEPVERS